ncbi:MAG: transcription/translation regulatory transformer protein RfaH [Hydrogenophilales bacterium]|nr:transcription/translation regulatory transformer protein RfaH [Hydrogenophilales bacterium]
MTLTENQPPQKSWYLIYTKPRQEALAQENLVRQGYGVYLPKVRLMRRRRGKQEAVVEPLFPRYLFIHLDTQSDNWAPIRSTFGVASLVRFGSEPAQVPDELVARLKSQEGQEGLHEWAEPKMKVGDRVRVAEGPLKGVEGILLAKTGQERVMLLLEMLGKEVRTHLATAQIEPSDG